MEESSGNVNGKSIDAQMAAAHTMAGDQLAQDDANSVAIVEANMLPVFWGQVHKWLADALAAAPLRSLNLATLYEGLTRQSMLLFVMRAGGEGPVQGAAVVGHRVDLDGRKWLTLLACGGEDMEGWIEPLGRAMKRLCSELGWYGIIIAGRPGWTKVLEPLGTVVKGVVLTWEARQREE
jgi:hypothetical protein